jgi:hypothetical protein
MLPDQSLPQPTLPPAGAGATLDGQARAAGPPESGVAAESSGGDAVAAWVVPPWAPGSRSVAGSPVARSPARRLGASEVG